jgi:hypothetical protein
MSIPSLTIDEMIATINRSSLPVVAVEGQMDAGVLRHLESRIGIVGVLMPCGGNRSLFALLDRLDEIKNRNIAFLADQDVCCVMGGHKVHPHLVYTWGYSIENDIIAGSKIDRLINEECRAAFHAIKRLVVQFFAYELDCAISDDRPPVLDVALAEIVDVRQLSFKENVKNSVKILKHDTPMARKIERHFKRLLRGKQLLQLYMVFLNRPKTPERISNAMLLSCCTELGQNRHLERLARAIQGILQAS